MLRRAASQFRWSQVETNKIKKSYKTFYKQLRVNIDMLCPNDGIELVKGHLNAVSNGKRMDATHWHCTQCDYTKSSQHNGET